MLPFGLIKMLMSDGFGDKVIQLFFGFLVVAIVCFAWWTTSITEQPHYRTVFLLERRLRRRTSRTRLTTHIQSASIGGEEEPTAAEGENRSSGPAQNSEANKPPEAGTSSDTSRGDGDHQNTPQNIDDEELETIVQIMDADTNVVRLRRLAYYENQQREETNTSGQATTSTEQADDSNPVTPAATPQTQPNAPASPTNSPENLRPDVANEPIMEHNYAEREPVHINPDDLDSSTNGAAADNDSNIRIKLKYLNDDLKLVDGRLEEQLGDFKRRHFQIEFSSNKLVRLIFNGQVLQPDTETLQSCGLFDNCVVHCLVHQQRNVFNESSGSTGSFTAGTGPRIGVSQGNNNNNNQGRDWDLGNVLFAFVSIILGSAWYFRYEYAHLYTVTATVALVAITGIFTIFLVGVYFPDPQPPQPRVERHSIPT